MTIKKRRPLSAGVVSDWDNRVSMGTPRRYAAVVFQQDKALLKNNGIADAS
jgi:hypothetical protein